MVTVTATNERGESIDISPISNTFFLQLIEGLGDIEATNQTQSIPYQDGTMPIDTILGEREVSIELRLIAKTEAELPQLRQTLSRIFNPKIGQTKIEYNDGNQTKIIYGKADSIPAFPTGSGNRTEFMQKASITMTCSDPYWKDEQEVSRSLQAYESTFSFPFRFPIEFGIEGDSTILDNMGSVETPIQLNIQGPIVNPKVTNRTTDEYLKLERGLQSDEVLHINTNPRNKRVEIHREGSVIEKAWGYLDDFSDFFKLMPGNNEIAFVADSGMDNAVASIAWRNQYAGI